MTTVARAERKSSSSEADIAASALTSALKELRRSARAYRKISGRPASKLMSGGAPLVTLDNELLSTAVCVATRDLLLPLVPKGGIMCEVGTSTGAFAREIARQLSPAELHLIDHDFSRFEDEAFARAGDPTRLKKHVGPSWDELGKFSEYFDLIYIDAGHSYADVSRDIAAALGAVKRTGFLMFNDYCRWSVEQAEPYGVMAAVNELANRHRWAFRGIALSGTGHFDVLLSRATDATVPD